MACVGLVSGRKILPPGSADGDPRLRYERVAAALTASLVADPLLCELVSVLASVLERNVSPDGPSLQARVHGQHGPNGNAAPLIVARAVPDGAWRAAAGTLLSVSGVVQSVKPRGPRGVVELEQHRQRVSPEP